MAFDFRRLDVYRKVPKDLTQPTTAGAIISVVSCLFIFFLFISELASFMTVEVTNELYVDDPESGDTIPVFLEIFLPNLQCQYVGIDIQDEMGRHEVGFVENTDKVPANGGQGCLFTTSFNLNKVPGNFHVSTHSASSQPTNPDMTHEIRTLRFGEEIVSPNVKSRAFTALNGKNNLNKNAYASHDYVMKIVPTVYESLQGRVQYAYQYTSAYKDYMAYGHGHRMMPAIWFKYELMPITVNYKERRQPFYHFITMIQSLGSTSGSLLDEPIKDITGEVPLSPTVITSGQNLNVARRESGSQIGESWSLQISGRSGSTEPSLRLSASAVEVSVESNSSDPVTTAIPRQGTGHSHRTVDNCHFPTQVSDADVEMTEDQPTTSVHGRSSNSARPNNIQEEESAVDPIVISDVDEPVSPMQENTEWASAFPCNEPEHPNMQNMRDRLETFNGFWTDGIVGNIAEIARAGFYCYDINQSRCFYCGISGHDWSPHEDPWEVHAALRPNCEYLLQQKGPDYVSDVFSRRHPDSSPSSFGSPQSPASPLPPATPEQPRLRRFSLTSSSSENSPSSSMESFESRGLNMPHITILGGNVFHHWDRSGRESQPPRVVDPRQEEAKRKKMLETSLNSEVVLTAMEMGFELPMIKRVIKRKIWRTDTTYTSPSMLLDDLLHPPADLDSDSDEDEETNEGATGSATGGPNVSPSLGIGGSGDSEGTQPAVTNLSENMDQKEIDEKLREYEHEKRCKVCLDRDADVVFIPCGHLCTCVECAQALRSCPMCRKRIQKSIKTYSS